MKSALTLIAATVMAVAALSCGRPGKERRYDAGVLVIIGDTALTLEDVVMRIPPGLEPADSAALFAGVVDDWIEGQLLEEAASRTLADLDKIDRMVEQYRRRLIVNAYRRAMLEGQRVKVSPDSVDAYWRRFGSEMILDQPLVKGLYLKISAGSPSLGRARELMAEGTADGVAELERDIVGEALHYDNFTDRWVDWGTVAAQMPCRINDADAFLSSTKDFETTYNGNVYILHVTGSVASGRGMPKEYADGRIREILYSRNVAAYEKALVKALYQRAIDDGRLTTVSYDPVEHKFLRQNEENNAKR